MLKKSGVLLIILLVGGLVLLFQRQLLNGIQQRLIRSIGEKAGVDNRQLLQDTCFSHHLLYNLKGTGRLWPHRVNSLQRFRYLYSEFPGFECDIQFLAGSGALSIGHDGPGPDRFEDYLRADSLRKKLFWLDVKNVNAGSIRSLCARLLALDTVYGIRNRVIVELYDTVSALAMREQGFLTALNVASIDSIRITGSVNRYPRRTMLLSAEVSRLQIVRRAFPGSKQISWDIGFRDGMDRDNLIRQANDTDLLVCLINVKSPGYR